MKQEKEKKSRVQSEGGVTTQNIAADLREGKGLLGAGFEGGQSYSSRARKRGQPSEWSYRNSEEIMDSL